MRPIFAPPGTSRSRSTTRRRLSWPTRAMPRPCQARTSAATELLPDPELPRRTIRRVDSPPTFTRPTLAAAGAATPGFARHRALHPHVIEHSWFGRSGRGYRFDHAFVVTRHSAQVRSCAYLHAPREQGLTDHAAMALTAALITESD